MPYTFENLNVPYEPATSDIRWMIDDDRDCEMRRNHRCCLNMGSCASCIYARDNRCRRKRFAMEKFPDMFFEGIYTWGIVPEVSDTFMLRIGEVGCANLGRRHPSQLSGGGCRMDCRQCIFAYENSHTRLAYYKKHYPNVKVCEICGNYHKNMLEYKGHFICEDCFNRGVSVCTVCGGLVAEGNTIVNKDGVEESWCSSCVSKHRKRLTLCTVCGKFHYKDNCVEIAGGYGACKKCYETECAPCAICGAVHPKRNLVRKSGILVCDNCKPLVEGGIHFYSFKPTPFFNKLENEENPIYFGIELEVGAAPHSASYSAIAFLSSIKNHYKNFYLKSDSSIPSYGFEIVTHPCSYQYFKSEFPWDKILSEIKFRGLKGYYGCGIHIHISRSALSEYQWLLFDYFINTHKSGWENISNRKSAHYYHYTRKQHGRSLKYQYGGLYHRSRYCAVNFNNCNTVEVRTFQSTTDKDIIFSYLNAVYALVNFIKEGRFTPTLLIQKGKRVLWNEFKAYLSSF